MFFASIRDRPAGYLNTPLTVVAAVLSKWLDIYSGVLMVRVLLSWFPNIPWDRQPLSAIRDLCDPYLNLFRNIIPLVFDTLMVALCLLLLFWVLWVPFSTIADDSWRMDGSYEVLGIWRLLFSVFIESTIFLLVSDMLQRVYVRRKRGEENEE